MNGWTKREKIVNGKKRNFTERLIVSVSIFQVMELLNKGKEIVCKKMSSIYEEVWANFEVNLLKTKFE